MAPLLLLVLFSVAPVVRADAGDFHKWAVIVGTLLGSTVVLAILGLIIYFIFIKRWLDDFISDSAYRQDVAYRSRPKVYVSAPQQKTNIWNGANNHNGAPAVNGGVGTKFGSSNGGPYDQYYGGGDSYQTKTTRSSGSEPQELTLPSNPNYYNYQQAYQHATSNQYNSEPRTTGSLVSMGVGAQLAAHNNQFGMSSTSTLIAQDPYNPYSTYMSSSERQPSQTAAYASYRTPTSTHRNQVLSAAYTGSSV